ncbi:GGDEF domain-containing protein [Acinetobacter shaoyimingii]|uniref:diguanylate cyclase n=1 Tax=Acinetobacter shaoyimingii TaxID=2715164 RepID=A0A6G8RTP0_9GAMM|nr:GGDEF domain-containing protein [Acinetobacter shaoyimingii]QIO05255.1 GGDEF domain-containing protein [Acinetobacter shaoyimingii]
MLNIQVNFFSLLIPIFLMATASGLFILSLYKKLPQYMLWLSYAIFASVVVQVIQTIIVPDDIYRWAMFNCLLFFICVACTAHAVYLRLGICTRWSWIGLSILFAECLLAYFCFVEPRLEARLIIVAVTSALICSNNIQQLIHVELHHFLDRLLKYSLYGMVFTIGLRAIYMFSIYSQVSWLANQEFIWASTQFLLLFFAVFMIAIFISCSIQDTIARLSHERNLDPLTGLMNRRAFEERIEILMRQPQQQFKYAVIICDIDHFKKINDQYGHKVGDGALRHVAQIMNKAVRKYDEVARIGGEEFLILLYDVEFDFALDITERLRLMLETTPFKDNQTEVRITASFGLCFFEHLEQFQSALHISDQLLYQAKDYGRNNVRYQLLENTSL